MNTTSTQQHSFAYVEPTIVSILILSSFIYLLNVARSLAHRLCYAGLIGEILVGIIYAAPLSNILKTEWEQTILDFGYIGLLLLVFEGGLQTRLDFLSVKSNLCLSVVIALTGIFTPIGLSIVLCTFGFKYSLLESFTMGASLSATSLGTTFAVLSSQTQLQLNKSRMGTILFGAALLDDISGLVIASVIGKLTNLGQQNLAWLILKPIVSSIVMIIISFMLSRFILRPLMMRIKLEAIKQEYAERLLLFVLVSSLSGTVTIAAYTGASTLLGAYCTGACLRYLDDCRTTANTAETTIASFTGGFEKFIIVVKDFIFVPFFFASIGFAVPFLDLWHGKQFWQGILYALLMIVGKIITGVWIIVWTLISSRHQSKATDLTRRPVEIAMVEEIPQVTIHRNLAFSTTTTTTTTTTTETDDHTTEARTQQHTRKWKSSGVYPALIVGLGMVSRGEIGFLIANIGLSVQTLSTAAFVVTIWAIILNTILGPIAVGVMVKLLGTKLKDGMWID